MKVLVYGGGARNHAICDKYGNSPNVSKVYFANGNPGILFTTKGKRGLIENVEFSDFNEVAEFCVENKVNLVDIGSETPLSAGLADIIHEKGIPTVGPLKKFCILESDRAFTDDMLKRIGVPKPEYKVFDNPEKAKHYARKIGYQVVVKANGLAAGKGAIVCDDVQDAIDAIELIMEKKEFGDSGNRVVIEERKYGTEISFFVFMDGKNALPLRMFAQDYKRAFDDDDKEYLEIFGSNPNTGGTGSYCPHKLMSPWLINRIIKEIVNPTVNEIYSNLKWDYKGIMYFGLNIDPYDNLDVFEINVRWGDPEAQVLLRKLSSDLFEIGMAIWEGNLDKIELKWNNQHYVNIVAMEGRSKGSRSWYKGYPGRCGDKHLITGLDDVDPSVALFFGGVILDNNSRPLTLKGRVLNVIAGDKTLESAREKAYNNIKKISFVDHKNSSKNCMRYRKTIGL